MATSEFLSFEYVILYYFAAALLWVAVGSVLLKLVRKYVKCRYPQHSSIHTHSPSHPGDGALSPTAHEQQRAFCYGCAADRPAKTTPIYASKRDPEERYLACVCDMCGDLLHSDNWLPTLVNFMDDYKHKEDPEINARQINADFPIHQFASVTERVSLVLTYLSAGFNVFAIASKFADTVHNGRDSSGNYGLTQYILAVAELALVGAFVVYFMWKSLHVTRAQPRQHGVVVWLGILMTYIPQLGKANALWAIRFWDVDALVELFYHSAYIVHSGPAFWSSVVKFTFVLIRFPLLLFLLLFPALGIFCRLLQVHQVIQKYITQWGYMDWITFLSFVNNFRFIADRLSSVMALGDHLYGDKVYYLFADILDQAPGSAISIATLITTTGPAELHEMTKRSSHLWIQHPSAPVAESESSSQLISSSGKACTTNSSNPRVIDVLPSASSIDTSNDRGSSSNELARMSSVSQA